VKLTQIAISLRPDAQVVGLRMRLIFIHRSKCYEFLALGKPLGGAVLTFLEQFRARFMLD